MDGNPPITGRCAIRRVRACVFHGCSPRQNVHGWVSDHACCHEVILPPTATVHNGRPVHPYLCEGEGEEHDQVRQHVQWPHREVAVVGQAQVAVGDGRKKAAAAAAEQVSAASTREDLWPLTIVVMTGKKMRDNQLRPSGISTRSGKTGECILGLATGPATLLRQ